MSSSVTSVFVCSPLVSSCTAHLSPPSCPPSLHQITILLTLLRLRVTPVNPPPITQVGNHHTAHRDLNVDVPKVRVTS